MDMRELSIEERLEERKQAPDMLSLDVRLYARGFGAKPFDVYCMLLEDLDNLMHLQYEVQGGSWRGQELPQDIGEWPSE